MDALQEIEAILKRDGLDGFTCYRHGGRWIVALKKDGGFNVKHREGPLSEALLSAFSDPRQTIDDDIFEGMDLI